MTMPVNGSARLVSVPLCLGQHGIVRVYAAAGDVPHISRAIDDLVAAAHGHTSADDHQAALTAIADRLAQLTDAIRQLEERLP